jgi:radical SAM-linked protein
MWERALRRARVPVAYTAGYSPRPQLAFGLALPTGCESVAEYLDVALAEPIATEDFGPALGNLLPDGVDPMGATVLSPGAASLQEEVTSCTWAIDVPGMSSHELETVVASVLSAEDLPVQRERKGRTVLDDLRPSVLSLSCTGLGAHGSRLFAELGTRPRGVRPSELGRVMGIALGLARRTCQWIERDGSRSEPIPVGPSVAALPWERAS